MSSYTISRHPEGITLNRREYILDENDEIMLFDTEDEAMDYLSEYMDLPSRDVSELWDNNIIIEQTWEETHENI